MLTFLVCRRSDLAGGSLLCTSRQSGEIPNGVVTLYTRYDLQGLSELRVKYAIMVYLVCVGLQHRHTLRVNGLEVPQRQTTKLLAVLAPRLQRVSESMEALVTN